MVYVNVATGEVLDFQQMSDEEIAAHLQELERLADEAKAAVDAAKAVLQDRMEQDGAKLRLTPIAKFRLHKRTRVRDKKLVERLYEECPKELRDKCFARDLRPLKTGLNELAKLGDEWARKVDLIYEETLGLKVEWIKEAEEDSKNLPEEVCPF